MKQQLLKELNAFMKEREYFSIQPDVATDDTVIGLPLFAAPLMGVCEASDEWFRIFQHERVIGLHHLLPNDWLSDAKSVLSIFLPFSEVVRSSNRGGSFPSSAWLHGRWEGNLAGKEISRRLCETLRQWGYDAVAPCLDERFRTKSSSTRFTSNWSERHVAFACSLGTFSLSRGLITEKGVAGWFISLITNAAIPPDVRQVSGRESNCSHCGACVRACPAQAISVETGKDHQKCYDYIQNLMKTTTPRNACGKCQAGMPCELGPPVHHGIVPDTI